MPAVKVNCLPAIIEVKLLNVEEPEIIDVPVVSKVTVPELWVNVPLEWSKFPEILNVPEEPGAVNTPLDSVKLPFTSTTLFEAPVNVPPLTVKPPLNVCVQVEAVYVPPLTVVRPVTVVAKALASYTPAVIVKSPPRLRVLVKRCNVPVPLFVKVPVPATLPA